MPPNINRNQPRTHKPTYILEERATRLLPSFRTERAWSPSSSVFPCLVLLTFSPYTDRSLYLTACNMPGLAVLHPTHFLPLTPPSSDAPSSIATVDSFSLSDCELLQRRPSLSIPLLSPLDALSFPENPFHFSSLVSDTSI